MRYSTKHKAQTRARLLKKASEDFREKGLKGTGIAKLMGQMRLTHGGFYGHFANKSDLVMAAINKMFEETIDHMQRSIDKNPRGKEVSGIVDGYLSPEHRDHPEHGCLLPVLAPEIAHQPKSIRKGYTRGFTEQISRLAQFMPGVDDEERRQNAQVLLAGMAGTMMFARAVDDPKLSDQILRGA